MIRQCCQTDIDDRHMDWCPAFPQMTDFILRKVPDDLWRQVKSRAALDGQTMRSILLTLIAYYAEHGLPTKGEER